MRKNENADNLGKYALEQQEKNFGNLYLQVLRGIATMWAIQTHSNSSLTTVIHLHQILLVVN